MRASTLLLLAASLASHGFAQDTDKDVSLIMPGTWNQWRGPDRTGHCPEPAWPERLDDTRLTRLWRIEMQPSYSGPIVDGKTVYTTETADKKDEVVYAVDRETGEVRWTHRWSGAMSVPFFAKRNGSWIRSTPALDDGHLYVAGMRDVLVCLDAVKGEEVWHVDFTERYGTPIEDFGFVCSPLVVGDAVYVQTGAGLIKLDKKTGESHWRSLNQQGGDMMKSGAFSSPVVAEFDDKQQLLVQGRHALYGVDPESGEALWNVRIRTFRGMNILTPTPYEGGIFTSAYGGRAHFFDLKNAAGSYTVEEKWSSRAQGYMTSPVVVGNHAYLYLRSKRFSCVDLTTGESAWTSEHIGDTYWSLVAQGDRILALSDAGELRLIAADPKVYRVIDYMELTDHETWAHLAVDGNQVFVRELDALTAYAWN